MSNRIKAPSGGEPAPVCGLAGHVVIGVSLNAVIVALVTIEVFTGLDPFRIRP